MRGAISAGMVAAIKYIGLENTFDVIYGSSAGSIVGAYFVARQLPVYGAQIYYDVICSIPENGQRFIDLWALRHHPYLRVARKKDKQYYAKGTRPVLLLDRLIDTVMREQRPLIWSQFLKYHNLQPLRPVASSLKEMRSHPMDSFTTMDEFLECLRASARVPGIAGDPVEINGDIYADGLLFEPIPFRSAVDEQCTDVLVLRTRPEGSPAKLEKAGIYEKHIATPYFDMFPSLAPRAKISDYLLSANHIAVYNNDIARLRAENMHPRSTGDTAIFSITPHSDAPRLGQLECRAKFVYEGVRNGFAAAYDTLSAFADFDLNEVAAAEVKTAKGVVKRQRMTAGVKASKWVFSDEELADVEKRHEIAKRRNAEARREARSRQQSLKQRTAARNRLAVKLRKSRRRRNMKHGLYTSATSTKASEDFSSSIEEHYFVG